MGDSTGGSVPPKPPDESPKYAMSDTGPYFVFVERVERVRFFINEDDRDQVIDEDTPLNVYQGEEIRTRIIKRFLHPMVFGKFLYTSLTKYKHAILGISSISRVKVRVEFQTGADANTFVSERALVENNYEAYIPQFLICKFGIIKDFSLDLEVEDLLDDECTVSPCRIIKAERMNRRVRPKDDSPSYMSPSTSVKITFLSQRLPNYIVVHSVRSEIFPFISRPVICLNCMRYGHRAVGCRGKKRCGACGNPHDIKECQRDGPPKCLHCNGEHVTTDFHNCEEYKNQTEIKRLMAERSYSFREALRVVRYKPFSEALKHVPATPLVYDTHSFPSINSFNIMKNQGPPKRSTDVNDSDEERRDRNQKKHFKFKETRVRKTLPPKPKPNYVLPQTQINLGKSPLPPNPHRTAGDDGVGKLPQSMDFVEVNQDEGDSQPVNFFSPSVNNNGGNEIS